jgi:hypothetical protein
MACDTGSPKQRRHALLRNDFQARDELKVPEVEAGDIEAESQSRDPDDEVLEWYGYTLGSLFTFGDRDDREADIDFAVTVLYLFEDLPDGVTSTLGGDHNT